MRIRLSTALVVLFAIGPVHAQQPASPAPAGSSPTPPTTAGPESGGPAPERSGAPSEKKLAKPVPPAAYLEEVVGKVVQVDRQRHRIVIQRTAGGEVTLEMDRNTLVYGPNGLATVLDVGPGAEIRAGRNTHDVAYWIAVRSPALPPREAVPTLGQGSSATTGAGPPASERPGVPGAPPPGPPPARTTAPGPLPGTPPKP